ncbi:MAG TPA: protease pro-enzyme activation domain-containing protein, partial [Thermoplasmata archaeon]|nr:protease pro-enzyme activation domain-containing protein [Thermoplasmata archaeon]
MSRRRFRFVGTVFAALLAGLLLGVLPPLPAAGIPPGTALPSPSLASPDLPAVLLQPAAARFGYDAQIASAVLAPTPATGTLAVAVTLWPSDPSFYLARGPGAPDLSASEVGALYGETPTQYAALGQYFQQQGLSITHLWPDRLALSVSGPADRVGAAFRTTEMTGVVGGRALEFAATPPSLPAPFAGEVAAVSGLTSGLSTFSVPLTDLAPAPAQGRTSPVVTASAVHLIYGLDALYNYSGTPHWATGVGIALL